MSWPVSSPPPTERHGPRTTSTPAKPAARPATRRGVGRSSGSMNVATTSVSSGVVAFHMPASTDEMRVSPSASSRNGIELPNSAITNRWPQTVRPAGRRRRVSASAASSTTAPSATRPKATSTGANVSTATLIERKLEPQISARSAKRGRHEALWGSSVTRELWRRGLLARDQGRSAAMPTEPEPITLADLARRAVQICDPQDTDAVLGDYFIQFEDADEPVTAIQNLEERVALAAEGVDVDVADPSIAVANAVIIYLAHRRDELDDDPEDILRLAARSEWKGNPPEGGVGWLAARGVRV